MPVPIIHTLLNSDLSLDMVHGPLSKMKKKYSLFLVKQFLERERIQYAWGINEKNPAYGRQSISRPMWIIAPIPQ